jgi:hypothetical protein
MPYPVLPCYDYCEISIMPMAPPETIPVSIDSLEMVHRFEVTDEAAVLKIDQHIGDFKDPVTHEAVPELSGLGLTINYWSSFSSYNIDGEFGNGTEYTSDTSIAAPVPQGRLQFDETDELRTQIEFGGTYLWGKDGGTYDVGTVTMPMYYYIMVDAMPAEQIAPAPSGDAAADLAPASQALYWNSQNFYYSSCYSHWDGYSITHDPVYTVFPGTAPSKVSNLMNVVVLASIGLGAVGLIATSLVLVRINAARKTT